MTEALILNLTTLPAPGRGGAASAARAACADGPLPLSFAAEFERSLTGPADALIEPTVPPETARRRTTDDTDDRGDRDDTAAHDALNEFLAQWLAPTPTGVVPPRTPATPAQDAVADLGGPAEPALALGPNEPPALSSSSTRPALFTPAAGTDPAADAPRPDPPSARHGGVAPTPVAAPRAAAEPAVLPPKASTVQDTADRVAAGARPLGPGAAAATDICPTAPLEAAERADASGPSTDADPPTQRDPSLPALDAALTHRPVAGAPAPAPDALPADAPIPSAPPVVLAAQMAGATARTNPVTPTGPVALAGVERPTLATRSGPEAVRSPGTAGLRSSEASSETGVSGRPRAARAEPGTAPGAAAPSGADAAQQAGPGPAIGEPARPPRPGGPEAAAPGAGPAATHAMPNAAAAAPASSAGATSGVPMDLATPVHSPQFAEALGVQVSVLARGGIERAELQLNPASMGPLAVHITLDAGQAQVHFGSDSAQTRQIVEAGLPALAAALRDAGFTLTGGGVSQHPGDPRHGAAPRDTTTFHLRIPAAQDDDVRPQRGTRAALGRLDLYA